ncbi:PQQ-dependent sugar dehydrogenase [Shewanella sp. D64]|uniref:PQQ-dependent sugar dehydrogenase n=1 Tax=unclassified Shewanella TaxID=196818 RepID=UPI0022BA2FFE|nr:MULTISPECIES: PQQ-dependent sugar dehydrogenase [unclassified Shewanella]MEC4729086.1 PQQ-dependent sugar dehydrogenase [Shewanella sp. D64]MEC4740877.1 PQQ-dependent sugar dehydrogenase [Shewanella sp. E94]WBJ94460.1 PQQ-dependent sugar dehydrogenase [Shewanella sp. MTB7]
MKLLLIVITILLPTFCYSLPLDKIALPPGFAIDVYAEGVDNARQMALGNKGTLFVGSRKAGKVYALIDSNNDKQADQIIDVANKLFMPSGIVYYRGDLYVAEVDKIWRYPNIEASLPEIPTPELVYNQLPDRPHHGWKFIKFGPDGQLYIPVGAPCNVCESKPPFASIIKLNLTNKTTRVVASGVRNSVGFDFHPQTGDLWFTDNGRDMMGDDLPDDELNHVSKEGQFFGFPYIHNDDIQDPKFSASEKVKQNRKPALKLGAHVASLGMEFYQGNMFPAEYKNNIFIAEHGSWNRSKKVGYRIVQVILEGDKVVNSEVFASGWLQGEESWGRPVAVLTMPDGSLLVSDDAADAIYRISYKK